MLLSWCRLDDMWSKFSVFGTMFNSWQLGFSQTLILNKTGMNAYRDLMRVARKP